MFTRSIHSGQRSWLMAVLLLAAVLAPMAAALWFMQQAMQNESYAARQRLMETCQAQLADVQKRLNANWQATLAALPHFDTDVNAAAQFAATVRRDLCDGVVIYGPAGQPSYPQLAVDPTGTDDDFGSSFGAEQTVSADQIDWSEGNRLETAGRPAEAADVYAELARATQDLQTAARALQAQARCLLRLDRASQAIAILTGPLANERYRQALDESGRSIACSACLSALEAAGDTTAPFFTATRERLIQLLNDYEGTPIPAAQRVFLMRRLRELDDRVQLPMLAAEQLAATYLGSGSRFPPPGVLWPTAVPDTWALASADQGCVALFTRARIQSMFEHALVASATLAGVTMSLLTSAEMQADAPGVATLPAGDMLHGWHLRMRFTGTDPFADAAERRIARHLMVASLVGLLTIVTAGIVWRYFGRQMRLTQLKSDLIATVSHELKTPLASMRALVDTLLIRGTGNQQQTREYLELIAGENARLSRLIENFLAFSRMEHDRHVLRLEPCPPQDVAAEALAAVRERFAAPGSQLESQIDADLPMILADRDALITALLNLLDNAYKYTGSDKHVWLEVRAQADGVCFEIRDNGVGLSRRAIRRVFEPFYQVDRRLSRRGGGCGLGLSIVRFIVEGHGGKIDVQSELGRGSVFAIWLPAVAGDRAAVRERA